MRYKIIGDSCLDLTKEMRKDPCYSMIPLTLMVGERHFVDDETFDQKEFIKVVKEYPECPKSACPSPEMFKEAYCCEEENVFVITLSAALSGSYNSAVLAKSLYEEEYGKKNILVLDSKSASSGQLNIAMYIRSSVTRAWSLTRSVKRLLPTGPDEYVFCPELDTLKRTDALGSGIFGKLNIKPVMGADNGTIIKLDQARGIQKALQRMAEIAVKEAGTTKDKRLVIAHCNAPERAQFMKEKLCSMAEFKEVVITDTCGVSTVYASDGGVILAL
ncbi:MAG: DegV family protein [Enterocloster sp.]